MRRARHLARTRTHVHPNEPLRDLLGEQLGDRRIEDLAVPSSASPRASNGPRSTGSPRAPCWMRCWPAVLSRVCCPRCGSATSTSSTAAWSTRSRSGRAVALGARRVYVLQVGRIDRPLQAPTRPWQVASVAFEIARRHRFGKEMAEVPPDVEVHLLPTGAADPPRPADLSALRYRDFAQGLPAHRPGLPRHDRVPGPRLVADPGVGLSVLPPLLLRRLVLAPASSPSPSLLVTSLPVLLLAGPARSRPCCREVAGAAAAVDGAAHDAARVGGPGRAARSVGRAAGSGWRIRSPRFQRAHYALVRWYLQVLYASACGCCTCGSTVEGPPPTSYDGQAPAHPQPPRRPGRLVPRRARAGQLVRPGAADHPEGHAAVGPGDRRDAQPAAEPLHPPGAGRG